MIANLEQFEDEVSPPKHHASFRGLNAKITKKKKRGALLADTACIKCLK